MKWYELQQPAVALLPLLSRPKIVYPIIANECRFTLDKAGFLINDKAFILSTDDLAVLGLLNSRIANFYFARVCAALEGAHDRYLEFRAQYVDRFPVPPFQTARKRLSALVDQMLKLHERLASAKAGHERDAIQRQIDATDAQIDRLVYDLYGLTDDEIKLVEESTA
jgi:hypothetical protein